MFGCYNNVDVTKNKISSRNGYLNFYRYLSSCLVTPFVKLTSKKLDYLLHYADTPRSIKYRQIKLPFLRLL